VHNYFVLSIKRYPILIQGSKKAHILNESCHSFHQSTKTRLNIPPKLLLLRSKAVSIVKFSISEGTLPVNLLAENDKICRCLQLNKVDGIVPIKQLPFRNKY